MPNNTHARQSPRYCHESKSISAAGKFNRYAMPASRLSFFGFKLTGLSMKTWCMFVAFTTLVLVGCDGRQSEPTPSSSAPPAVPSSTPPKDRPPAPSIPSPQVVGGLEIGRTYDITSKADLREGLSGTAAKKVNQKASDILKAIHYMSVDSSVTVRVLDVKSEWVEIQIIEPEHLSATHRGWIPKSTRWMGGFGRRRAFTVANRPRLTWRATSPHLPRSALQMTGAVGYDSFTDQSR